jgi:CDP-diacylglycerol---serine O-phosphatidyltransferase
MAQKKTTQKVRGIYLLPNLLSTAGLFVAFYAIVAALKGRFESAAVAIFIAMLADILDGRVARMTHTESDFGAEYDSLCDMVSFGLAPALVLYTWALQSLGKFGWLVAFIYTATTGLRLARFNTQIGTADKSHFQGLPCPAAAGVIAGMVWSAQPLGISPGLRFTTACVSILASILMVSNIRYYSFKELDLKGRVPFVVVVLVMLLFVTVSINPPLLLLLAFSGYMISGPLLTFWSLQKHKRQRKRQQ